MVTHLSQDYSIVTVFWRMEYLMTEMHILIRIYISNCSHAFITIVRHRNPSLIHQSTHETASKSKEAWNRPKYKPTQVPTPSTSRIQFYRGLEQIYSRLWRFSWRRVGASSLGPWIDRRRINMSLLIADSKIPRRRKWRQSPQTRDTKTPKTNGSLLDEFAVDRFTMRSISIGSIAATCNITFAFSRRAVAASIDIITFLIRAIRRASTPPNDN